MASVANGDLLGRERELERIVALLDGLETDGPVIVAIGGEPGIGKTRLLAELTAAAALRGAVVRAGRASEYEADLPYALWLDALGEGFREADAGTVAPMAEDRHRLHATVRDVLEQLATDAPVVVVLDDVHWADPASVELIGALLRRPPRGPVLLALGLRPRQAPERLAAALARAERDSSLEQLTLEPLDATSSAALLGDAIPASTRELLYLESGGNPFYLEHLARASKSGTGRAAETKLPGVPGAVAGALAEELRELAERERLVVEAAAVAGDPFEPHLVAAVADLDEGDVLTALDGLVARDLVRPTDSPRRFTVRHPLVRRAIYELAGAGWRLEAHGRAAAALAEAGAQPAERAHHVAVAARPGDAAAISVLVDAAMSVSSRAPATTAQWLRSAIDLIPDDAEGRQQRLGLMFPLCQALSASGQLEDARGALLQAIELVDPTMVEFRVTLVGLCARIEMLIGRQEEALRRVTVEWDRLEDQESPAALTLLLELAGDAYQRNDLDAMIERGGRAAELADALWAPAHEAAGLAMAGFAHAFRGEMSIAGPLVDRAAEILDGLTDEELALRLDAAARVAIAEMHMERFTDAARHSHRGAAVARATGVGPLIPILAFLEAVDIAMLGRLADAKLLIADAVGATRLMNNAQSLALVLMNSALVAMFAGELDAGRADAAEALALAEEAGEVTMVTYCRAMLAGHLLDTGDPAQAVVELTAAAGGPGLPLMAASWRAYWLEVLTRAELGAGRAAEASAAADTASAVAAESGLTLSDALARRAHAGVALHRGEHERALELARESAALAGNAGAILEVARSRSLVGRALAAAGDRTGAIAELTAAADVLEGCGAGTYLAEARADLRRLGSVKRKSARGAASSTGLDSLTAREREIADLVWDRQTNKAIAGTLFLSEKTIEGHLRNIYAKLRISSRVELARAIERARSVGA